MTLSQKLVMCIHELPVFLLEHDKRLAKLTESDGM